MRLIYADDIAPLINRSLLMVRVKAPFIEWANSLDDGPKANLETYETYLYLVDDAEDPRDLSRIERQVWKLIFEHQLANWHRDPGDWPRKRTLKIFHKWFETELHLSLFDVSSGPICEL